MAATAKTSQEQIVLDFFRILSSGELEAIRKTLHPDAQWRPMVENIPGAGVHGPRDVIVDLPRTSDNDRRRALIHLPWKIIAWGDDLTFEFFNIQDDPGETKDLKKDQKAAFEEMKQRFLPSVADGTLHVAFGITEPNAGTDTTRITTRARRDGDQYVINGNKRFISFVEAADFLQLVAATDRGRPAASHAVRAVGSKPLSRNVAGQSSRRSIGIAQRVAVGCAPSAASERMANRRCAFSAPGLAWISSLLVAASRPVVMPCANWSQNAFCSW